MLGDVPPLAQQELGAKSRLFVSPVVEPEVQLGEAVVPFVKFNPTLSVELGSNVAPSPEALPNTLNSASVHELIKFK
jgi:hypothetical protein